MTKILTGRKQIIDFVGRRWDVIKEWKSDLGFPMRKMHGIWESDTDMIQAWRREQIVKND